MEAEAVILAAGYSSRADGFKMEFMLDHKSILQHTVDAFLPVCRRVIVVGGYRIKRLVPLLSGYDSRIRLVENENYSSGMFSSVLRGVREVGNCRFFITPGDYPLITEGLCRMLLKTEGEIVIPSYERHGGHPILLEKGCREELLREPETSNLRSYIGKKKITYFRLKDNKALIDVDTQEDFRKIKELLKTDRGGNADGYRDYRR